MHDLGGCGDTVAGGMCCAWRWRSGWGRRAIYNGAQGGREVVVGYSQREARRAAGSTRRRAGVASGRQARPWVMGAWNLIEVEPAQKIQNFRTFITIVQGAQYYRYSKWLCGS